VWASETTTCTPPRLRAFSVRRNAVGEGAVLGVVDGAAEHLAVAVGGHAGGDDDGLRTSRRLTRALAVGRVQEHVGPPASQALGRGPAVHHEGVDGVLSERGLLPAGIAEPVGLQAAAHAHGGVQGVWLLRCPETAVERTSGRWRSLGGLTAPTEPSQLRSGQSPVSRTAPVNGRCCGRRRLRRACA
jgi:hypothetical protein